MGSIIGAIIFGAIVGVLARLVLPGRQTYGMLVTILLGIGGALVGYYLAPATPGIDWIRWIVAVAAAAVLSFLYSALTRRSAGTTTRV